MNFFPSHTLIIAEIGNNHEGNFKTAQDMLKRAAAAGADVVKFQSFQTEHYVSRRNSERFQRLKSFELSPKEFEALAELAAAEKVHFVSTPFDLHSAAFLNERVPAFKISSSDNTFYPLLESVARYNKPILLSTGYATAAEIARAKALIQGVWDEQGWVQELCLLHCVGAYPVPPEQAGLHQIQRLKAEFGGRVGYSDHTLGIEAAVLAVAAGAQVIEKHFTLDHHFSDFRDHQLSATPEEFRQMVERIRQAERYLGPPEPDWVQPAEAELKPHVRRHIIVTQDLEAGAVLRSEDISWVRPSGAFPAGQEAQVLGRTLTQPLEAGAMLQTEHLA